MRVYVQVDGAEAFGTKTVRNHDELSRVLDFARIGSQTGEPRSVYRMDRGGRRYLIAKYADGESQTSRTMRARRHPLWGIATFGALWGLRRLLTG